MSEDRLQKISLYLDGECSEAELRSAENAFADETVRRAWVRYHMIGDAMRGDLPRYSDPEFAARVSRALTAEATILVPPARRASAWTRPAAGFAIAASVAAVAVFGVRNLDTDFNSPAPAVAPVQATQVAQAAVTPPQAVLTAQPAQTGATIPVGAFAIPDPQWPDFYSEPAAVISNPSSQSRLNSYLVNYSAQRAVFGSPGVLPYVKVVFYEADR